MVQNVILPEVVAYYSTHPPTEIEMGSAERNLFTEQQWVGTHSIIKKARTFRLARPLPRSTCLHLPFTVECQLFCFELYGVG